MKKFLCGLFAFVLSASLLAGSSRPPQRIPLLRPVPRPWRYTGKTSWRTAGLKLRFPLHPRRSIVFKFDKQIMEQKAEELGADIIFQYANYDATKQANQVENLISQD